MSEIVLPDGVVDPRTDPLTKRFVGRTFHGDMEFDAPFITEIDENLFLGGCDTGYGSEPLVLPKNILHVVRLIDFDQYTVEHRIRSYLVVPLNDALDQDLAAVDRVARWVNECRKDAPTLVHCQAGLNRSALVLARALILDGAEPAAAISELRTKRSAAVLCNHAFEEWLMEASLPPA